MSSYFPFCTTSATIIAACITNSRIANNKDMAVADTVNLRYVYMAHRCVGTLALLLPMATDMPTVTGPGGPSPEAAMLPTELHHEIVAHLDTTHSLRPAMCD